MFESDKSQSRARSLTYFRNVSLVGALGFIAYLLTGFLGRDSNGKVFIFPPGGFYLPFWGFTFVWFCSLAVMLMWYMVRKSENSGSKRSAILIMTIAAMAILAYLYYRRRLGIPFPDLTNWPWYAMVNFGTLALYIAFNESHWFQKNDPVTQGELDKKIEAIVGEIIAGGLLALFLSLLFSTIPITWLNQIGIGEPPRDCSQRFFGSPWPCLQISGMLNEPNTISSIDTFLMGACFIIGPLILVFFAFSKSFAMQNPPQNAGITAVGDTLRQMIHFPTKKTARNMGDRYRAVPIPFLIFGMVLCTGIVAEQNGNFLHIVSADAGCYTLLAPVACQSQLSADAIWLNYLYQIRAVGGAVAALLCTLGAGGLLDYDRLRFGETLRFLRTNAILAIGMFCFIAISLSAANLLFAGVYLYTSHQKPPWPFPLLSVSTFISAIFLVVIMRLARKPTI